MRWIRNCLVGGLLLGFAGFASAKPAEANGTVETNRVVVGAWELVSIEAWNAEEIAIRFHTGYLSAEGGGGGDAIANRAAANIWEKWAIIRNDDGTFSFLASDHIHYLTAEPPSAAFPAGRLRVDRRQIGLWEKFTIDSHDEVIAVRSQATGHYLSAQAVPAGPHHTMLVEPAATLMLALRPISKAPHTNAISNLSPAHVRAKDLRVASEWSKLPHGPIDPASHHKDNLEQYRRLNELKLPIHSQPSSVTVHVHTPSTESAPVHESLHTHSEEPHHEAPAHTATTHTTPASTTTTHDKSR